MHPSAELTEMSTSTFAYILAACLALVTTVSAGAATFTLQPIAINGTTISGTFDYNSGVYSDANIAALSDPSFFSGDMFTEVVPGSTSPTSVTFQDVGGDTFAGARLRSGVVTS
jgi:hypothetical protein